MIYPAQATDLQQYELAQASWARTLEQFVDGQGRTDFLALAENADDLAHFVLFIESTSPASNPELFTTPGEVLAYHLNAYNALAMYGAIRENIPADFDSFFKRLSFFKFRSVVTGGQETPLQDYESDVIQLFGEPRVHFALNCMVRDCPRLPIQPFKAETLRQQLEHVTQEFFNEAKHMRVDENRCIQYVSKILDFYTEDFVPSGKAKDLFGYVYGYAKMKVPADYRIKFIDYDWTINQQPKQLAV